jgi:hypothetical protein
MVMTKSELSAAAAGVLTTVTLAAPARDLALSGERFQTERGQPFAAMLRAMPMPMLPSPMKPTLNMVSLPIWRLWCAGDRRQQADRCLANCRGDARRKYGRASAKIRTPPIPGRRRPSAIARYRSTKSARCLRDGTALWHLDLTSPCVEASKKEPRVSGASQTGSRGIAPRGSKRRTEGDRPVLGAICRICVLSVFRSCTRDFEIARPAMPPRRQQQGYSRFERCCRRAISGEEGATRSCSGLDGDECHHRSLTYRPRPP